MTKDPKKISDAKWLAVSRRDRHHDGKFVYVALTTSIYCRPSCPARLPHRRNVRVLPSAEEAEQHGYIACRRCHPHSLAPAEQSVGAALDYIDTHIDQPITLNTLSQVSGLSPNHLQQTFKQMVGLSPKAFCDYQRVIRLKELLRAGASVAEAIYGVGYGSSRALYERASRSLGMTPATYRRGGARTRIGYVVFDAPLGRVLIAVTERGVCGVLLGDRDESLIEALHAEFPNAEIERDFASVERWGPLVRSCQSEDPMLSNLSASLRHQVFQARLWRAFL